MKMNPEIKALWIATLRDGSFKRGQFQLRDLEDRYDASGVLCELAVLNQVIPPATKFSKETGAQVFFGYRYGDPTLDRNGATGLPIAVQEWAGIEYRTGYRIAMMGDKGKSFNKIADYIEETL